MERLFPDVFKPVYANLKKNISFYQDEIDAAEVRALLRQAISIGGGRIQRADASPLLQPHRPRRARRRRKPPTPWN